MPFNFHDFTWAFQDDDDTQISYDDCVDELDKAENRIYNLSLYLDYIRVNYPKIWKELNDRFDGMPGWTKHFNPEDEDNALCERWVVDVTINFNKDEKHKKDSREPAKKDPFFYS